MSGLIKRILGIQKATKEDDRINEEEEEDEQSSGEYSVPENLNPEGFYAIKASQAEMYDLGNIDFISHFILYNRKEKIAVDITSDVQPAPLLSATQPVDVLMPEGIETLEKLLTGKSKPQFCHYSGIKSFVAHELNDPCYAPLRARMIEVRDARLKLNSATNAFREQASNLRSRYLSQPSDNDFP
jgi:hypothetical protein